ncbi:squalene/phytoene synthase family protein [Nocardia sp. NPDC023852]|uniref:squalene/phytoene synthase family protein n=1 Tax=Nocardia sp. NPDC023852 TaxID=3154697 RepID=UPI003404E322
MHVHQSRPRNRRPQRHQTRRQQDTRSVELRHRPRPLELTRSRGRTEHRATLCVDRTSRTRLPRHAMAGTVEMHCMPVDFSTSARVVVATFEDLRDGRLCLPVADLDRHGVAGADLEQGLETPGVRALISATASSARASLVESGRILGEIASDYRPVLRFLIGVFHMRLGDVGTRGAAIIRLPIRTAHPVVCLYLMIRSRHMGASTKALPDHADLAPRQCGLPEWSATATALPRA